MLSMNTEDGLPIIFFDGLCNLCSSAVQFILRNDPAAYFRFCSLQSEAATSILEGRLVVGKVPDTVVLVEGGKLYVRSTAALRIARHLKAPWNYFAWLLAVPVPIRDMVYNLISANRFRFFGRRTACLIPSPALRSRFIGLEPEAKVDTVPAIPHQA